MHRHGRYERNVPRGEGLAFVLKPLLIPRFLCPHCRSLHSALQLATDRHLIMKDSSMF
jgi:hypothetical protein